MLARDPPDTRPYTWHGSQKFAYMTGMATTAETCQHCSLEVVRVGLGFQGRTSARACALKKASREAGSLISAAKAKLPCASCVRECACGV